MKKHSFIALSISAVLFLLSSCQSYLDIVPDNVATLDNAFSTKQAAKKYLFTCYSYLPLNGSIADDPGVGAIGDEMWLGMISQFGTAYTEIQRGGQRIVNPYGAKWKKLFRAIRICNTFLSNIDKLHDIDEIERRRWIAEAKFLKAYYNFYLIKMYGPIPLMKKNLPASVSVNNVQVKRAPVDSCFKYISQLIDEAAPDLPLTIIDPEEELGRITKVIALSFKAKVLVYAASPLFNGNTQESGLKNSDGTQLFSQTFSKAKWDSAAAACKNAVDICEAAGMSLYYYQPAYSQYMLSDTITTQLSIRNSICEKWNSGIIWANTRTVGSTDATQKLISPKWDRQHPNGTATWGQLSPSLEVAAMFYTKHGVPITEDKTWGYADRYQLKTSADSNKLHIRKGYVSVRFNFDREPRFYADLGFDGGIWYGQGSYDDKKYMDLFFVEAKNGQIAGRQSTSGYFIKKLVHFQNVKRDLNISVNHYPFPIMRLSDLYLLYAEALNESKGPGPDAYEYIDSVRKRAGLPTVQYSWSHFSTDASKYKTQDGLRDIIHRERLIELAFEGQRFWDLRRWKEAPAILNRPYSGWDANQKEAVNYYRPSVLHNQTFGLKDYFWPIAESTLDANENLVQNIGW